MSSIERFNLFQKCIALWGQTSQILMAIEELNELAVVLLHSLRANKPMDKESITEEIADVQLMMEQLQYILSISDIDLNKARTLKLDRLKELIADEKAFKDCTL